jgi:GNAT superfamily N-acetyltransferase
VCGTDGCRATHIARPSWRQGATIRGVPSFTTRRGTVADVDLLGAIVQSGFDSYREFAPGEWRPPDVAASRDARAEVFAEPTTWVLIALSQGVPVGHVAFMPARAPPTGETAAWSARAVIPGVAHLWQLFVLPDWWGSGVAPQLHDAAIEQMRAEGYSDARLFTPSLQTRARRFYERHGWLAQGDGWNAEFVLSMTEYRLSLHAT